MNHYIYIKTKTNDKSKLLIKLYKNNINVLEIATKNDYLYLKIKKDDFKKIKKTIVTSDFEYISDLGIYHLKNILNPLNIFIITLFLILINLFSKVAIKVDVIHANKEVIENVKNSLEEYGIKDFSLKKSYDEIAKIKEEILNKNQDKLEWLEIESIGMKYIVRVEQRIINNVKDQNRTCHIVAKKSGVINSIISTKGEILTHEGLYVNEGDILISGDIKQNEEIKRSLCAEGKVYAEVWYKSSVHLPVNYTLQEKTGKKRTNFSISYKDNKYKILRSRLENYVSNNQKLFKIGPFVFYKTIEEEVNNKNLTYSDQDGEKKALELAAEKIKNTLKNDEYIKYQKVLKKSINNSTIDVEVFYSVIENIGNTLEYTKEEEVP